MLPRGRDSGYADVSQRAGRRGSSSSSSASLSSVDEVVDDVPVAEDLADGIMAEAVITSNRPQFKGEGTPAQIAIDAQAFLLRFDTYCVDKNVVDQDKQKHLIQCFPQGSKALNWWLPVQNKPATATKTWEEIRQLFEDRFLGVDSPSDLVRAKATLKMNPKESVQEFFDRCEGVQIRFNAQLRKLIVAHATIPNQHADAIVALVHDLHGMVQFVAGLQDSIRRVVASQGPGTSEDALRQAILAENAERDSASAGACLSLDLSDRENILKHKKDIEAIFATVSTRGRGGGGGRGRGGFRGSPRGRGSYRGNFRESSIPPHLGHLARPAWIRLDRLPADVCYTCGMRNANHFSRECTTPYHRYNWPRLIQELRLQPPTTRPNTGASEISVGMPGAQMPPESQEFTAMESGMVGHQPFF